MSHSNVKIADNQTNFKTKTLSTIRMQGMESCLEDPRKLE